VGLGNGAEAVVFGNRRVLLYQTNAAGTAFNPPQPLTNGPFYGQLGSVITPYDLGPPNCMCGTTWAAVVFNRDGIYSSNFLWP